MTWILAIDIGKVNMGYALYNGEEIKFDLFNIESKLTSKLIRKYGIILARTKILCEWLDVLIKSFNISMIVVEKQVMKNVVAKNLENVISVISIYNNIPFKTYDPKNKFKYLHETFNSKKKEHKRISEKYALNIIQNFGYSTEHYYEFKKKDDISDALCMAVFTFESKNEKLIKWLITSHI